MKKYDKEYYVRKLAELEVREFDGTKVKNAADVYPIVKHYGKLDVEYFLIITFDGAHRVIKTHELSKGILNKTVVHPREVYRAAIKDNAAAIILIHNHPSNQLEPSYEDEQLTRRLSEAGEIIGIAVLDHLILGRDGYFSFVEDGRKI